MLDERTRKALAAIIGAVGAVIAFSPPVAGADVTIGSDLTGTANSNICAAGIACTYLQTSILEAVTVVPSDGRVVRWRLKSGSAGGTAKLRVIRRADPQFTAIASSAAEPVKIGLNTFTTDLSVKAGDVLGVDNSTSGLYFTDTSTVPFPVVQVFQPALANGETRTPDNQRPLELLMNADVAPPGGSTGPPSGAPVIGKLRLVPSTFRAAASGGSIARKRPPVGTTVSYVLSSAATVSFKVERATAGRVRGGMCRRSGKSAKGKRCVHWSKLHGGFSHSGKSGTNTFKFRGRVSRRKLGPAKYRLVATPSAAGKRGKSVRRRFRIK